MNIGEIRAVLETELPFWLDVGRVVAVAARGINSISVRTLGSGRVYKDIPSCDSEAEIGEDVLIAKVRGLERPVVVGRILSSTTASRASSMASALTPPANLTATGAPRLIRVEWYAFPGEVFCYQVQANDTASETDAVEVLVTHGSYYDYETTVGTTKYFRVRAVRWIGNNNVMLSAWSSWVSGTATSWDDRYRTESELASTVNSEGASMIGVEDAAANFTATDVEGVLTELGSGGAANDAHAIHDNVAGEIAAVTEKVAPVSTDLVLIEDSAAANAKKRAQLTNLPPVTHDHSSAAEGGQLTPLALSADGFGKMFFTKDDGLLLLNSHGEINATEWWSQRKQKATLSGAFHQVAGRWAGTKALMIEQGATNEVLNPSFGVNVTDGWNSQGAATLTHDSTEQRFGNYSMKVVTPGAGTYEGAKTDYMAVTASQTHTASLWIKGTAGDQVQMTLDERDAALAFIGRTTTGLVTLTGDWQSLEVSRAFGATGVNAQIIVWTGSQTVAITFYVDGVDLVQNTDYATSHVDGSLGPGYAWSGTAHNSTSTRTVTEVNLDDHVSLISGKDTLSFRVVIQAPYDYDATWPANYPPILDAYTDTANRLVIAYDTVGNRVYMYVNGTTINPSASEAFSAGDWLDIVATLDFAGDSYKLYLNGVEIASSTAILSAPTLGQWNLGSSYGGTNQSGWILDEAGVWGRVLTAAEVAQLYVLQRPLTDAGAMTLPPQITAGMWTFGSGEAYTWAGDHTQWTEYGNSGVGGLNGRHRITFAGIWTPGSTVQFEASLLVTSGYTMYAKLQYYDTDSSAWVDVQGSEITTTSSLSYDRVRSSALSLPLREFEYRVLIRTNDASNSGRIQSANLIVTSGGGSTTL